MEAPLSSAVTWKEALATPGKKTTKGFFFFFFLWLEILIKLDVWAGGTQFSKRKKFCGVGLIKSGESSNWRIAALVLGGLE